MSTKCTILCDETYHFYFDYKDNEYHLDIEKENLPKFLNRVGKILESCPLSDSGIYHISMNDDKSSVTKPQCPHYKKC